MLRLLKRFRGPLLFLMLLSVTTRVFTGAQEAQVNFTSLLVDQNTITHVVSNEDLLLNHAEIKNSSNASSNPDKHHTYATYKKYLTPDKFFAVEMTGSHSVVASYEQIAYISTSYVHASIYLPVSNSPPIDVFARSLTHTSTADSSVVLENYFGEIEIDNSAGGLGSYQL